MTMVAGKILYEDGEFFIGTDAAHIYEKANEITQRIMSPRSEFNQYNLLHALVQQRYLDRNVLSQQAR